MLVPASPEDFLRSLDVAKADRRRQRDAERASTSRPLGAWERYRVLGDHTDALRDQSEHIDRKTRFALLILGGLNAINLAMVLRGADYGLHTGARAVTVYAAAYLVLSLAFFSDAIAALRPRRVRSRDDETTGPPPVWSLEATEDATVHTYRDRWMQVELPELSTELASTAYELALENRVKLRALTRVYWGLYVLVGLTAVFVVAAGWAGARLP